MSHDLICSCLQLSADQWPPDYYTLLGLEPGEADSRRIEQRVQERMEKLRRYQLTHADQVTEAMNRLAQALVCLTDPVARQAYDAELPSRQPKRPPRLPPRSQIPVWERREVRSRFRSSVRRSRQRTRAARSRTRAFPRWLLFAWIAWVSIGVTGLVALIRYFPAIKQSYLGTAHEIRSSPPVGTPR